MSEKIIIGNIITVDDSMPKAEAAAIRDGIIVKVGTREEAQAAVSDSAEVMDYTGKWIYPGFLDSHTHGMFAGFRAIGQADLSLVQPPIDLDEYRRIIKKFIDDNPEKEIYAAAGWAEDGTYLDYTFLDEICSDKPLVMNTAGGHSCLLNTKAMEHFGIDDAAVEKYGTALVHVGPDGHPDGYVCEEPAMKLLGQLPKTHDDIKKFILKWQEMALSHGITAVGDAGVEILSPLINGVYKELEEEGKLALRTRGYLMVPDHPESPAAEAERIANTEKEISGEYFKVVGIKAFLDGVVEAHTGWLLEDYDDEPGYHGVERFNNPDKMTELLVEAQKRGLSVHVHAESDGAVRFMLKCVEKAQEITKDKDQRNILAHLHLVSPEDIKRMADTKSIAAVPPLWTAAVPGASEQEIRYIGQERYDNVYPIKSFIDEGATIVFHSDYPISPYFDIPQSIFMAIKRGVTILGLDKFEETRHNTKEGIDSMQSLKACTTNVAYAWREDDRMGSITAGKIANFAVVDVDFLDGDVMTFPDAKILATIVDGNVVYENK